MSTEEFTYWLNRMLDDRGWSQSELARRAGVNQVTISRVLSGARQPGNDLCHALARTLDVPADDVFRLAGLLPPKREAPKSLKAQFDEAFDALDDDERENVLNVMKALNKAKRRGVVGVGVVGAAEPAEA